MAVSFGLTIPQRGAFIGVASFAELLAMAPRAEESGFFDSVWVGDSLTAKPRPESLTMLGALAGMTETLRLGVGCMASFPVRDPAVFAYQWATLDQISGGRMALAACTGIVSANGASGHEGKNFGGVVDMDRPLRMVENIEVCRRLWAGEELDFDGKFVSYEGLKIEPQPVQAPCPIWIAANPAPGKYWERALRRVASLADGFQTCLLAPGVLRAMRADLDGYLSEAGRDPSAYPVMAYHNVNIGSDRSSSLEESQQFLDAYYGPTFTPEMVREWTAAGTPDECIEQLRDVIDQGATEITLRCTSFDQAGQFERLVAEVLPAFR